MRTWPGWRSTRRWIRNTFAGIVRARNHDPGCELMMCVAETVIIRLPAARRELVEHKKIVLALTTRKTIGVNLAETSSIHR